MLGLCENKVKDIGIIWRDKEQLVNKQERFKIGGTKWNPIYEYRTVTPIDQLGFELFNGDHNPVWGYLASKHPDEAVHYPFLGYVACANYDLGGSVALSNHNFEVISDITFSETIHDANPADVIEDFISNPRYGAAPNLDMVDLSEFRT